MTRAKKPADQADTYGTRRQELDRVLAKLQDSDCDVDEAVGLYEQALRLIGELETYLQRAENRVEKVQADFAGLTDSDADGVLDRGARS